MTLHQPILRRSSAFVPRAVLIVDDSAAQRRVLALQLTRWGYEVTESGSGDHALALCQNHRFDIILSDWMMPGMDGPSFCRALRELAQVNYSYFILLTSKSDKAAIADGLENGADDFVSKPVNSDELHARLRAGERILQMQEELFEKNDLITATLQQLQAAHDSLDRDLIEARKLQQTLMRDRLRQYHGAKVALMLHPSGHVGGDLVGSFAINDHRVAVFSLDVSGHGVASAMMTASLAGMLSGSAPDQNLALRLDAGGQGDAWPPAQIAARLNRVMMQEMQVEQYFTLAYAELDLITGQGVMVQAGHPHPVILRRGGGVDLLGRGGLPIGLFDDASYDEVAFHLHPGDRLFLMSDGITECCDPLGQELGSAGLVPILQRNATLNSPDLLEALIWDLHSFADRGDFSDDVSGLILDYQGR